MKLRIKGNSVRLRLSRSEAAQFAAAGEVTETVRFGALASQTLVYALISSETAERIGARYDSGKIAVIVPKKLAEEWTSGDQIGIEGVQALAGEEFLKILIEKDFACLAERAGEDESDNFPNPKIC